jgi:hypothetical protein
MFVISFFACSPSVDISDPDAPALEEALVGSGHHAAASIGPDVLELGFLGDVAGFVELRPYADVDGMRRVGAPLLMHDIEGTEMNFALPFEAPRRDRAEPTDPVVYAISLRAVDRTGRPGVYTGLSYAELVWLPAAADGGIAGWNLAHGYGSDTVEWLDITAVQHIGENLAGQRNLSLAGSTAIVTTADTRMSFATGSEPGDVSTWDEAIGTEWQSDLPDRPAREAVEPFDGVNGAMFAAYTYEDVDGDGMHTDEALTGHLCAGAVPVVATWFAPFRSLPAAMVARDNHFRAGWSVYAEIADGLVPLADGVYLAVRPF